MTTTVHVYDKNTSAPIEGATVTCTDHTPQLTDGNGNVSFDLFPFTHYELRANANGYVISGLQSVIGADPWVGFGLEKEEEIIITVKRPTWVSMDVTPTESEYPAGETITIRGSIRKETIPATYIPVWLLDADTEEILSISGILDNEGNYVLTWTPSSPKVGGYNITVGCNIFKDAQNPSGAWSNEMNGYAKNITVVGGGEADMAIHLPNPYSLLFVDHTIIACDDPARACTDFTFNIKNDGNASAGAWYKVSIVGGSTVYDSTIAALDPGETSTAINDLICAEGVGAGGLPIGTHTIKVEVGALGKTVTDTKTEDIFVLEEQEVEVEVVARFLHWNYDTHWAEVEVTVTNLIPGTHYIARAMDTEGTALEARGFLPSETTFVHAGHIWDWKIPSDGTNVYYQVLLDDWTVKAQSTMVAIPPVPSWTPVFIPVAVGWLPHETPPIFRTELQITFLNPSHRYDIQLHYGTWHQEPYKTQTVTGVYETFIAADVSKESLDEHGYGMMCIIYDRTAVESYSFDREIPTMNVTVNMPETIAIGGIPSEMQTRTDTSFTFVVDNKSTMDLEVDVLLDFRGVGTNTAQYPRDYTPPLESNATAWEDGFVASSPLPISAWGSRRYTLTIWLPDEAVPEGYMSSEYTIHTRVAVQQR